MQWVRYVRLCKKLARQLSHKFKIEREELEGQAYEILVAVLRKDLSHVKNLDAFVWSTLKYRLLNYINKKSPSKVEFDFKEKCSPNLKKHVQNVGIYNSLVDDLFENIQDEKDVKIIKLKLLGYTQEEIATELNMDQSTVSYRLKSLEPRVRRILC